MRASLPAGKRQLLPIFSVLFLLSFLAFSFAVAAPGVLQPTLHKVPAVTTNEPRAVVPQPTAVKPTVVEVSTPKKIYEPVKALEPAKENRTVTNSPATGAVTAYKPVTDAGTARATTGGAGTVAPPATKTLGVQATFNLLSGTVINGGKNLTLSNMRDAGTALDPQIEIATDKTTYNQGETINLRFGVVNPGPERDVDFYLVLSAPTSVGLHYYPTWATNPQHMRITLPANLDLPLASIKAPLLQFQVGGGSLLLSAEGNYKFAAGLAKPGTADFYGTSQADFAIGTGGNKAPSIISVSNYPEPIPPDTYATFTAQWTDPDTGDTAKMMICGTNALNGTECRDVQWCSTYGYSSTSPSSCQKWFPKGSTPGTFTYYAFVCDDEGLCSGSKSGTVTVLPNDGDNEAPEITDVFYYPYPVEIGQQIEFVASWDDESDDKVKLIICKANANNGNGCAGGTWCDQGIYLNADDAYSGTCNTTITEDVGIGDKTYYAFVCDDGGLCSQSIEDTFTVIGGSGNEPKCSDIYINANDVTVNEGEVIYRQFSYGNSSDERFDVDFVSSGEISGGQYFEAISTDAYDRTIPAHGTGNYEIEIRAYGVNNDESGTAYVHVGGHFEGGKYCGYGDIAERNFTVYVQNEGGGGNNAPNIEYVDVYPNPVDAGDSVNFEVHWSDPENYAVLAVPASGIVETIGGVVRQLPLLREFMDAVAGPAPKPVQAAKVPMPSNDSTKMFICKTSSHDSGGCSGGTWCSTDGYSSYSPSYCSYETSYGDSGTKTYYAFVCDDDGLCSSSESGTFTIGGGSTGELDVSINPQSATVESSEEQKFYANVSGGSSGYSYNWSLSSNDNCETYDYDSEFHVTCTNEGSSTMNRTIYLNVTSGSKSGSASAKLYVEPENDGGDLSVSISPESATVWSGESQTFTADVYGGTGQYNYDWSLSSYSDCETNDYGDEYRVTCTNGGSNQRSITVHLTATSGSKSGSASATLEVEPEGGSSDPISCYNKSWGPSDWEAPSILWQNAEEKTGVIDSWSGFFQAEAKFKWDSTNLNEMQNKNSTTVFEFRRVGDNWESNQDHWDGVWDNGEWWGGTCYYFFYSDMPNATNNGVEESDGQWYWECSKEFDITCAYFFCNEEYEISGDNGDMQPDTWYTAIWKMAIDKSDGYQPTNWFTKIEIGEPSPADWCVMEKGTWTTNVGSNSSTEKNTGNGSAGGTKQHGGKRIDAEENIVSQAELEQFKLNKIKENGEILSISNNEEYTAVITFSKPLTRVELEQLTNRFGLKKHMVRYKSTEGGGEVPQYQIYDEAFARKMEAHIATTKGANFKLYEGFTAMRTVVPRNKITELQNDKRVFSVDFGPKEIYENKGTSAYWRDVAFYVEKFGGES